MKLKDNFVLTTFSEKSVLICVNPNVFSGIIHLNETAKFIVERLKTETTAEDIEVALCGVYNVEPPQARTDVNKVIAKLTQIQALTD